MQGVFVGSSILGVTYAKLHVRCNNDKHDKIPSLREREREEFVALFKQCYE